MIMSWRIISMEPIVGRTYLFLPSASAIWMAARETYSDLGNAGQLFEIKSQLRKARQGEKSVTQYYTDLKMLWQEMDLYCEYEWNCSKDSAFYQKTVEKERVFDFLVGLNADLDEVRGRILGRDPLPSTREVFSEVCREESRRQVMLRPGASDASPTQPEMSAMVTSKPDSSNRFSKKFDRPICEHCNRVGHIKAKCWKLHGKPADSQRSFNDNKSALQVSQPIASSPGAQSSTPEQSFFNKDNLEQLLKLWNSHQSSLPSSSLAQKGIHMTALKISLDNSNPWI